MPELVLKSFAGLRWGADKASSVWTLIVLIPLALAIVDPERVDAILFVALDSLLSTLPYIVTAVLLVAYLKTTGAEVLVAKAFEGRETRMIILAAMFGGLAPFCSCEVIPFISGLLAVGAPLSAVMAFWLSSPLIDPPTILITAGALGWEFAIAKTLAAVVLGLIGGFSIRLLTRKGVFSAPLRQRDGGGCSCGPSPFAGQIKWRFWLDTERLRTFASELMQNGAFLIKWLTLAYLLAALLVTYVPAESIGGFVGGDGFLPIVIGALVGAPAYLNSYAAPALVSGLMEQGMSAGAAMAFMIAGAVSCIPAMAAVWSLVKHSVFLAYVGLGLGGAITIGAVFGMMV